MTDVLDRAAEWIADPDSLLTRPTRPLIRELSDCLVALRAERDEALADAARYRWLRSRFRVFGPHIDGQHGWCAMGDIGRLRGPNLDAAIDAALKEK